MQSRVLVVRAGGVMGESTLDCPVCHEPCTEWHEGGTSDTMAFGLASGHRFHRMCIRRALVKAKREIVAGIERGDDGLRHISCPLCRCDATIACESLTQLADSVDDETMQLASLHGAAAPGAADSLANAAASGLAVGVPAGDNPNALPIRNTPPCDPVPNRGGLEPEMPSIDAGSMAERLQVGAGAAAIVALTEPTESLESEASQVGVDGVWHCLRWRPGVCWRAPA